MFYLAEGHGSALILRLSRLSACGDGLNMKVIGKHFFNQSRFFAGQQQAGPA
jgi:hypothetical protein